MFVCVSLSLFFDCACHCFCEGFPLVAVKRGLLSSCGPQASHCGASLVAEHGLWGVQAVVVVHRPGCSTAEKS